MHASVLSWASAVLTAVEVQGRRVLEVGACDVNGSVRPLVEALDPGSYLGVDQAPGRRVDRVVSCVDLPATFGPDAFDVVISTEMLEHVVDWQSCVAAMCDVVAVGGLLLLTTRSVGFPYHPFPIDAWRYGADGMAEILRRCGLGFVQVVDDPQHPGVFATGRKPAGWEAPWADRSAAAVLAGVDGVTAVGTP